MLTLPDHFSPIWFQTTPPAVGLVWLWAAMNFCSVPIPGMISESLPFGHSVPWAQENMTLSGLDLFHTFLGQTSILSSPWLPSGFFFFLFPQNISLQMSRFRTHLVFRKTHSSAPLNLKVKMHTLAFPSPWEMTSPCVTPDVKFAWIRQPHSRQPTNFSSQLVETQGKIP